MNRHNFSFDAVMQREPAGIKTKFDKGASECFQPTDIPSTPENLRHHRRHTSVGRRDTNQYDKLNNVVFQPNHVFGKKSDATNPVSDIFKDEDLTGMKGYMRQVREARYGSNRDQPLGRGPSRNYVWPETILNKSFAFGAPTQSGDTAKEVMQNKNHSFMQENEKTLELYKRTHARFESGEQRKRGYNFPFNVQQHVFGIKGKNSAEEAKSLIQPEFAGESFPKTVILNQKVELFKDYANSGLGMSKNLGQMNKYVGPSHIYGYKRPENNAWNAGKCIYGMPTTKDVLPDLGLGQSIRVGNRNLPRRGDEYRAFGVPTIRNDIDRPRQRSVADYRNYGDESGAVELLRPDKFNMMGVAEKDFDQLRHKEEIRRLFSNIGYRYKPGKFEGIFLRAEQLCNSNQQDMVSIRNMIEAIKEMDHIE